MEWPNVTVIVITYNRPQEIRRTISALAKYMVYSGKVRYVLADDGSPDGYVRDVQRDFPDLDMRYVATRRGGWGKNVNNALKSTSDSYVFMIEDDYVAERRVDLSPGIALMETERDVGLVRYDGIAGHNLNLRLRVSHTGVGDIAYATIDHDSPHLNVYSNRPQLKGYRFHAYYGYYPEGRKLGETEEWFAHRVKDMPQGPKLAILADGIQTAFVHIGHSWQGSPEDK